MIQALILLLLQSEVPRTLTLDEPDLRIGAAAWYATTLGWVEITRGSQAGSGTHMVTGSDVDLDPGVAPAIEARLGLAGPHAAALRFSRVESAGTRTADNTFIYQGNTFDAGRRVKAEMTFLMLEGDYQLEVDLAEGLRATAHAGLQYWKYTGHVKTADGGPPIDSHRAFDSAFWMAGAGVSWSAMAGVELRALGVGGIQRANQNFFKVEADALLHSAPGAAVAFGYRLHAIRFRQSSNRSNLKFHGPTLGLELAF